MREFLSSALKHVSDLVELTSAPILIIPPVGACVINSKSEIPVFVLLSMY